MADDMQLPESDRIDGQPHPRETLRLVGQGAAERRFLEAWNSGRLHHAWLLRGPMGIGKATLAYRIARALIAQPPEPGGGLFSDTPEIPDTLDAPEGCAVRARIVAQAEPRLLVLRREWDIDRKRMQTQISVDNVRAVRRFLGLSAADGGWRVIIVDTVDELNRSSANALLKFLEEPPAQTIFLLISHAPAGLLPTIRSRCRTLDLAPLAPDDLSAALLEAGSEITTGGSNALAELSGGSVGRALRLLSADGPALYADIVAVLCAGRGLDRAGALRLAESCAGRDAAPRYAMALSLIQTLIARMARAAAIGTPPPHAAPGEGELMAATAHDVGQASPWAEALAKISATSRHAVAVNLDPAQCVLDTFLELDTTLSRVRTVAA